MDIHEKKLEITQLYKVFKRRQANLSTTPNPDGDPILMMDYRQFVQTRQAALTMGTYLECISALASNPFTGDSKARIGALHSLYTGVVLLIAPMGKQSSPCVNMVSIGFLHELRRKISEVL